MNVGAQPNEQTSKRVVFCVTDGCLDVMCPKGFDRF